MSKNQPEQEPVTAPIGAIPFFPELIGLVPNVTTAVLVTYFEMRYPAPQDHPGFPVTVSAATLLSDLRISRRTLALSLYAISRVFPSEAKRWAAARGGREFLLSHCTRYPKTKVYSIVCAKYLELAPEFILRRNTLAFSALPSSIQFQTTYTTQAPQTAPNVHQAPRPTGNMPLTDGVNPRGTPMMLSSPQGLADILLSASVLSGDRRSVRYPRLRKAVASGLEDRGVLSAKQPKRKTTLNKGVEPDLPEELARRLGKTK